MSTMEELVEKYIELRDVKAKLVAKHKEQLERVNGVLDRMEGALLTQFNELGMEAVRTKSGTAYKSTRVSTPVQDWDAALAFIREHELYNMLERRVSKQAVEQYKDEHGDLPPGIGYREEVVVNIRRS